MSMHRRIEIISVICIVLAIVGVVFAYALHGPTDTEEGRDMAYESTLFDTSKVHTIDIVIDDWDSFIEGCEDEKYESCAVVVDGESFKNVAIRAKGNTSLSSVKQMDSDRYSFKIEFDHYNDQNTYHGLDKLSLNNIIQDNTYMKDYLTYQMMDAFGVDAPLSSYAFITVNGEDWGLYLAVEAVEDSFLQRIYGTETGDLYKPDSTGLGGGRGNGKEFDMDETMEELDGAAQQTTEETPADGKEADQSTTAQEPAASTQEPAQQASQSTSASNATATDQASAAQGDNVEQGAAQQGGGPGGGPGGGGGGMGSADVKLQYIDDDFDSYTSIFENAKTTVTDADKARLISSLKKLSSYEDLENILDMEEVLRYFVVHDFVCNGDSYTGRMIHNYYLRENEGQLSMIPWDYNLAFGGFDGGDATSLVNEPIDDPVSSGSGGMGGGMGQPGRQDPNAQTQATETATSDSTQSTNSTATSEQGQMPAPPEGGQMGQMPTEAQGDSSQSTNSTATSEQGQMPAPPEGGQGFQSGSSSETEETDSRPMVDWIFTDEAYTARYHELYSEFLNSVDIQSIIDNAYTLIAPYVERDPTKFCTTEEFTTGVETLKQFCTLRSQSVAGQLAGTIPSTEEGQEADSSAFVDASSITISDMGSMGAGGGQPGGGMQPGADQASQAQGDQASQDQSTQTEGQQEQRQPLGGQGGAGQGGGAAPPGGAGEFDEQATTSIVDTVKENAPVVVTCAVLLAAGFGLTFLYRRG